jgi:hypothetical protein
MEMEQPEVGAVRPRAIVAGGILLTLGVAMLLDTTGAIDINFGRVIAPLVLIAIGSSILLENGARVSGRQRRTDATGKERIRLGKRGDANSGVWLVGIGAWMLLSQSNMFGLSYANSWPLFIILAGIMIAVRGWR